MPPSLFQRVTRYNARPHLNQRENRLTESTALALEHVDRLAPAFVQHLLELGALDARRHGLTAAEISRRDALATLSRQLAADRVAVETQVRTIQGRYVDLEILLRPRPAEREPGLLVWVEVKHGAGLHGDQLEAYLEEIEARFPGERLERAVVLLGPRGWSTVEPLPERALHADWQALSRALPAIERELQAPEQRWLLAEYIAYLKEEGLSDPDALTVTSALALMHYEAADEAAAGICEHADAYVTANWGDRTNASTTRAGDPTYGIEFWANHETHRPGNDPHHAWDDTWFEWGLRYAPYMDYVDGLRGSYVFIAGATAGSAKKEPVRRPGNEAWVGRRQADGFERIWLDPYYRLVRMRYPDELLTASTLEAQGRLLGEWIVEAFDALAKDPPDVSA